MNAEVQENTAIAVIPPKLPTVTERAAAVFATVKSEEELKELAKASATIVTITNSDGKEQCHAARMVLKNTRLEIARTGEEGRDDAVKTSKAIIARQKALIAIVEPEELRLQAIQDEWDAKVEAEKQAKINAEIARVKALRERVEELRGCQTLTPASGSQLILEHISDLEGIAVDASFEEFQQEAVDVKAAALIRLNGLLGAAVEHEAAQQRLAEERAELAKRQAEQDERDRLAKIEIDRLAQEAHDRRVAEARAHAEQIQKDRARIANEEAAAKAIRDAEAKRIADERAENERIAAARQAELDRQAEEQRQANAAEERRLAEQRAELERQQAALVEAQKPAPVPEVVGTPSTTDTLTVDPPVLRGGRGSRIVERPSAAQLVALVSEHYGVSLEMATKWILTAKVELEQAA